MNTRQSFSALATWFCWARERRVFPPLPFELRLGHRVVGEQFFEMLGMDARLGEGKGRDRFGAVRQDLLDLQRVTFLTAGGKELQPGPDNPYYGWCPRCWAICQGLDSEGNCLGTVDS